MELLLRGKQAAVFFYLKGVEEAYLSQIAKETGTTYVYITGFASLLQEKGFVEIRPEAKKKLVRLTEKGKEVASRIESLREAME
jgi:DNA-binding MarR family transcriptional regulator